MKKIKSFLYRNRPAALMATMLLTGLMLFNTCHAERSRSAAPARTWHTEVTTLKASVTFYGGSANYGTPLNYIGIARASLNAFMAKTRLTVNFAANDLATGVVQYIMPRVNYVTQVFATKMGLVAFVLPVTIDLTEIVAEYGQHYEPMGQSEKDLRTLLYQATETAAYFSYRKEDSDTYKSTLGSHSEVLQAFQKGFVTKGGLKFRPHKTPLFKMMIDRAVFPDEFWATYLGFFEQLDEADRSKWPFIAWYLQVHLIPKMKEDYENQACWGGVYVEPTEGVAGPASESMDGLNKVRQDMIAANRTTPISTGALETDDVDFCTQVEEFVEAIPQLYRKKVDFLFMDTNKELRYRKGKKEKYNKNYTQEPNLETISLFPNLTVVGLPSMGNSEVILTTTPENRIRPTSKAPMGSTMLVSLRNNKEVIISSSFREALGFEIPELVFTNDQELI